MNVEVLVIGEKTEEFDLKLAAHAANKAAGVAQPQAIHDYFDGFEPEALAGESVRLQCTEVRDGEFMIPTSQLSPAISQIIFRVTR